MTRRQRQLDELRSLCGSGHIGRAVDLAFEHFATFGHDEQVVAALAAGLDRAGASTELRARLAVLAGEGARRPP